MAANNLSAFDLNRQIIMRNGCSCVQGQPHRRTQGVKRCSCVGPCLVVNGDAPWNCIGLRVCGSAIHTNETTDSGLRLAWARSVTSADDQTAPAMYNGVSQRCGTCSFQSQRSLCWPRVFDHVYWSVVLMGLVSAHALPPPAGEHAALAASLLLQKGWASGTCAPLSASGQRRLGRGVPLATDGPGSSSAALTAVLSGGGRPGPGPGPGPGPAPGPAGGGPPQC
jgi:hypothetical protein